MATALDDLLEAFPNGWTPAESTKPSGSSLFDTPLDTGNGISISNGHSEQKLEPLIALNGKHTKPGLNDINLFDEPISEIGDHEPLMTASKRPSSHVPNFPARAVSPATNQAVQEERNPAEDILTSLLYPGSANGASSHSQPRPPKAESASRVSQRAGTKQTVNSTNGKGRSSQPPPANSRASAWAGSNPATIKQASASKSPPSGYGYTPPTAISPKGTIRISGIAKAVEAQRAEDKLRRKEEKRRSQEKEPEKFSNTITSTSQMSPEDFLRREPSDSSDEGWIDAATYNARKGWRRPNVPHSVQDDDEDNRSEASLPEIKKPDMWSQEDVEVEKMEQARVMTERTEKMQLLDFEVAPEPDNIVPAWQPSMARPSNKYPAPRVVREARPPNTFKSVPRHREPDTISHKSAHWADEDDVGPSRGLGRGRGRARGDASHYNGRSDSGRRSGGPSSSPEHSLSGSNAIPVSRDPEARLRSASDWIQPRIEVAGPFQDQYRSAWEAQRKGITNPRSNRGRGVSRY